MALQEHQGCLFWQSMAKPLFAGYAQRCELMMGWLVPLRLQMARKERFTEQEAQHVFRQVVGELTVTRASGCGCLS